MAGRCATEKEIMRIRNLTGTVAAAAILAAAFAMPASAELANAQLKDGSR